MDKAVIEYQKRRDARIKAREDAFEEGKHKRDKNGRFTSGGSSKSESKAKSVAKNSNRPRRPFAQESKDWEAAESKEPKVSNAALARLTWEEDSKKSKDKCC